MNKESWPKLDANIKREQGFLNDKQIAAAAEKGKLISNVNSASAKYACYELNIGARIEQLVLDDSPESESDLYRVKNIPENGVFHILPGQTYKIYAVEELNMPADVFALAIPVGNMFKLGLNPETTFADPGFHGAFYITVCNYSPRVVRLKVGDPLARMFFCKLADRPEKIHEGRPREIAPAVERVARPTIKDLEQDGEANLIASVMSEVDPPHFQHAYVTDRLFSVHRNKTNGQLDDIRRIAAVATIFACISLLVVFLVGSVPVFRVFLAKWPNLSEGVFASLIATISWAVLTFGIPPFRRVVSRSLGTVLSKDVSNG